MNTLQPSVYLQDRRGAVAGLPDSSVRAVTVDSGGGVWVGASSGVYAGTPDGYDLDLSLRLSLPDPVDALLATPDGLWVASGSSLQLYRIGSTSPEPARTFTVPATPLQMIERDSSLGLVYPDRLLRVGEESETIPGPDGVTLRRIATNPQGRFLAATDHGLWIREGEEWAPVRWEESAFVGDRGLFRCTPSPQVYDVAVDPHGHAWVATDAGVILRSGGGFFEVLLPEDGLPMHEVHSLLLDEAGSRWFVHPKGISRLKDGEWRYFAGRRWLPGDTVSQIVSGGKGGVFAATDAGLGWIAAEPMTLEEKARRFEARLRARHVRSGFVSTSILETPGDVSTSIHEASDNDGLWTSLYVAAECFRYRVTGDPAAKANAIESMAAMERLERVTSIPGFPARALVLKDERVWKSDPETGEWHPFSVESRKSKVQSRDPGSLTFDFRLSTFDRVEGEWKGDTSSDELVGHFFACAVFHDSIDDEAWRARAAAYAGRLADHLIQNDFNLIDLDGQHTRWGFYSPRILNTPEGEHQRGLNSLEILQHLKVAHALTGEARFGEAYHHLVHNHHYALNTLRQKITVPGHVNHSDDELAFLSYYPLLRYETDPALLAIYRKSFRRSWEIERPERSPFLNFLYGGVMDGPCDADLSRRALEKIPLDIVHWRMENSHRADLPREATDDRFDRPQSTVALSPAERGMLKWNGNPYRLDDGSDGRVEEDGAFFLLPYWMGRAYGLI
ncbi:MAG: hypothetical protein KY468_06150 [Armatimonadetes bacterium]|nr:hypothetical protein [Armatimonadota bacterium]